MNTQTAAASRGKIYTMSIIAVMTAVTCVLAPMAIPMPFSPVPISLPTWCSISAPICWAGSGPQ